MVLSCVLTLVFSKVQWLALAVFIGHDRDRNRQIYFRSIIEEMEAASEEAANERI